MGHVETDEFSLSKGDLFELVVAVAGSVSFKRRSDAMFAPQMSIWTADADGTMSPQDRLTEMLEDMPPAAERRHVSFADMDGEWSRVEDRLKDYETEETRPWHRIRVLLVAADGSTWYHATAMADGEDLPSVQAELEKVLASVRVKATGELASEARAKAESEVDAIFMRMQERVALVSERRADAPVVARVAPPVKDIEATFAAVAASSGVTDLSGVLRRIALPTLAVTEAGGADPERLGQSRVGGGPDLPEGVEWLRDRSGFHLNFLAQIDLADLPERYEDIPASGLLSFFSGTDLTDGTVLYTPSGMPLVAHDLPVDAEDTAISGSRMVRWDSEAGRFVADRVELDGLTIHTEPSGRMTLRRDGQPVIVLASEYEISPSPQSLQFDPSLSVPFGIPPDVPQAYLEAGLSDPSDFAIAVRAAFDVGDGPQHQMFGVTGVRELSRLQKDAATHAGKSGWDDLTVPKDWFLLFKIASGGEANFNFNDHGDLIFMANRVDTKKGDFTRVHAVVESG